MILDGESYLYIKMLIINYSVMFSSPPSITCMGCERKIKSYFELYCLDCEYHVADVEMKAYDQGYQEGLSTRFSGTIPPIPNVYPFLYRYLIDHQDNPLSESSKRKHFIECFVEGFTEGFKVIRKTHNTFKDTLKELVFEMGKRLGPVYFIHWIQNSRYSQSGLVDYNLIRMVKKFIQ